MPRARWISRQTSCLVNTIVCTPSQTQWCSAPLQVAQISSGKRVHRLQLVPRPQHPLIRVAGPGTCVARARCLAMTAGGYVMTFYMQPMVRVSSSLEWMTFCLETSSQSVPHPSPIKSVTLPHVASTMPCLAHTMSLSCAGGHLTPTALQRLLPVKAPLPHSNWPSQCPCQLSPRPATQQEMIVVGPGPITFVALPQMCLVENDYVTQVVRSPGPIAPGPPGNGNNSQHPKLSAPYRYQVVPVRRVMVPPVGLRDIAPHYHSHSRRTQGGRCGCTRICCHPPQPQRCNQ